MEALAFLAVAAILITIVLSFIGIILNNIQGSLHRLELYQRAKVFKNCGKNITWHDLNSDDVGFVSTEKEGK